MPPTIDVTIVDSAGDRQTFRATHLDLECDCGRIDIRPGKPAFCRGFDRGVLTLDDGISVKTVNVISGMAALMGDAVHVICERLFTLPSEEAMARAEQEFPVQPTEAEKSNNKLQTNYII